MQRTKGYREVFARFLRDGTSALKPLEKRAMQADDDSGGGYLIAPQEMVMELLKEVDDIAVIRNYARVFQLTTSKSLGVPTLDDDVDDADWTKELGTGKETEIETAKRELRPHPLAKRVKVSNTLLRLAAIGPEALVNERLAYKFGITEEKAFMTGDGNQKPLGVFTADSNGISTSRDKELTAATYIEGDDLIDAKYELKAAYFARARWIWHRHVLREIRKIKDDNGQYIWQPGLQVDQADRVLDLPYTLSEFAPSTISADQYTGILGDFNKYWIAEALDMTMQRLVELYAETNQTGFIGRMEVDGMPVLEEAFVRMKMASSDPS